jgi:hypothetical protein
VNRFFIFATENTEDAERENALPRMAIKKIWLTKTMEIYYGIIGGRHAG